MNAVTSFTYNNRTIAREKVYVLVSFMFVPVCRMRPPSTACRSAETVKCHEEAAAKRIFEFLGIAQRIINNGSSMQGPRRGLLGLTHDTRSNFVVNISDLSLGRNEYMRLGRKHVPGIFFFYILVVPFYSNRIHYLFR